MNNNQIYQYENVINSQTFKQVGKAWLEVHRFVAQDKQTSNVAKDPKTSNNWDSYTLWDALKITCQFFFVKSIFLKKDYVESAQY